MSYCIDIGEPPGDAVRRIGREEILAAQDDLARHAEPAARRIHELRKHCKRLRALVRLARPGFADYATWNKTFRDFAGEVSTERDAAIMDDLVAALVAAQQAGDVERQPVVRWFRLRRQIAEELAEPVLAGIEQGLAQAAVGIERWDLADLTVENAVDGVKKTLQRAHKERRNVASRGSVSDYHTWRKRCKYHGYHLQLLAAILGEDGEERYRHFSELGNLIGEVQDRSALLERLGALPVFLQRDVTVQRITAEAIREQRERGNAAYTLCAELFEESPKQFAAQLQERWQRSAAA